MDTKDYSAVADIFEAMTQEKIGGKSPAEFAGSRYPWPVAIHFTELLADHASLSADMTVLDIGCGCGRIATALTQHIGPNGRFYGVDLVSELTDFATRWITSRYPNFTFMIHDQDNSSYNRYKSRGSSPVISSIIEHFPPISVDRVISTSLFTHLDTKMADNVLKSISHVLKSDGCALITAFLIDESTWHLIQRGPAAFSFKTKLEEGVYMENIHEPLGAVAFELDHFIGLLLQSGLYIDRILFGAWSGRTKAASGQDVLIIRKL